MTSPTVPPLPTEASTSLVDSIRNVLEYPSTSSSERIDRLSRVVDQITLADEETIREAEEAFLRYVALSLVAR